MPNLTITLTDEELLMVQWEARRRGISQAALLNETLQDLLSTLKNRHAQAHATEIATLFGSLSPTDQQRLLQDLWPDRLPTLVTVEAETCQPSHSHSQHLHS